MRVVILIIFCLGACIEEIGDGNCPVNFQSLGIALYI